MPGHRLAQAVEPQQVASDLASALFRALLGPRPLRAAQPAEHRRRVTHADVAGDTVELVGGDVEFVGSSVGDQQVLALYAIALQLDEAIEATDAMLLMHDEVARA